jgi:hypothetical protein
LTLLVDQTHPGAQDAMGMVPLLQIPPLPLVKDRLLMLSGTILERLYLLIKKIIERKYQSM